MNPVRLGIVGCGVIGRSFLKECAVSELLVAPAVADIDREKMIAAQKDFGIKAGYDSASALLADPDVEAVYLGLPAGVRAPIALEALAAGKHLLLEKPAAMNVREVREMINARGRCVVGCCSSRYRHRPPAKAARKAVESGVLGNIRLVRGRGVKGAGSPPEKAPIPWRYDRKANGGGILVNWGSYDLDYLLGLLGWQLKPIYMSAGAWSVPPHYASHIAPGSDAETHIAISIMCEGGAVVQLERGELLATEADHAWQIIGENASLRLDMTGSGDGKVILDRADAVHGVVSETLWDPTMGSDDISVHRAVVEDFAMAIREGRKPATGLEEALILQKITDAAYASAEQRRPVHIKD